MSGELKVVFFSCTLIRPCLGEISTPDKWSIELSSSSSSSSAFSDKVITEVLSFFINIVSGTFTPVFTFFDLAGLIDSRLENGFKSVSSKFMFLLPNLLLKTGLDLSGDG